MAQLQKEKVKNKDSFSFTYYGKSSEDMSRHELLEVIRFMSNESTKERESHIRTLRMLHK